MNDTKTQSVCKHCGHTKDQHHFDGEKYMRTFCAWCEKCLKFEPVSEPASTGKQPPHKLIEILENAPTEVARMEAARADHYMRYAARPSEPPAQYNPNLSNRERWEIKNAAPQTSAEYLKKCVKEGPDCDCVTVCKFDPQPVSGDALKTDIEKKYLIALRWFKLFYNFYQKDIEGKPSAAMSAMSEDSELQELLREADRTR